MERTIYRSKNLDRFFADIRKCEVLDAESLNAYIDTYKVTRDEQLLNVIISHTIKYIVSLASSMDNKLYTDDLIQEGVKGCIRAIDGFDTTRGFKFITFAREYILLEMRNYIKNLKPIVREKCNIRISPMISKIRTEYRKEHGVEISDENLLIELKNKYKVEASICDLYLKDKRSLSDTFNCDEDEDCFENSADFNSQTASNNSYNEDIENDYYKEVCNDLISVLDKREYEIIVRCFGLNNHESESLENIAESMGCSKERIRQLRDSSIRKMKSSCSNFAEKYAFV